MTHSFVAYIDESGDDGIGNFREPGKVGGASHWLVVSACLFRGAFDLDAVKWRDEISSLVRQCAGRKVNANNTSAQGKSQRDVHFKKLNHAQRTAACQCLAQKPIRSISILSNKRTAPSGVFTQKNQLYFYTTRYLIERISWLCRDMRPRVPEGDGRVKITFSRRGGMSYEGFRDYLLRLKTSSDNDVNIHWPVIDIDGIEAKDHSSRASLQLADIVASAFACGIEPDMFGNCERRYAEELKRIVYERKGNYLSYGLKMLPKHTDIVLGNDQQRLIEHFQ
jgi:hypothetical protein